MPKRSVIRACSRRAFLRRSTAAVVAGGLLDAREVKPLSRTFAADEPIAKAAQLVPGKDAALLVHNSSRLRLEPRETFNHHQRRRYRTPSAPIEKGTEFVYDFDNSDAN
jgi:hypothetical protein